MPAEVAFNRRRFLAAAGLAGTVGLVGGQLVGTGVAAAATPADCGVYVIDDFGPVGTTNDTATVQAAIDGTPDGATLVGTAGTIYTVGNIRIDGRTNFTFDGRGATLQIAGVISGTVRPGVELAGTVTNITITNWVINGSATITDQHAGVFCQSGTKVKNLRVIGNTITNVTLGVSINAVSAQNDGTLSGILMQGNYLENIVGTASGYGYGLHVAYNNRGNGYPGQTGYVSALDELDPGIRIVDNMIVRAQRHSIYHAAGWGSVIANNRIWRHRYDVGATNFLLSAIMLPRSYGVTVTGNIVSDSFSGALYVGGTTNDVPNVVSGGHVIANNRFARMRELLPLVVVGQQAAVNATDYPTDCTFIGNEFATDNGAPQVMIYGGKRIRFIDGMHVVNGATASTTFRVAGTGESAGTSSYTDDLAFTGNRIAIGAPTGSCGFRLNGAEATGIKLRFDDNSVSGGATFAVGTAVSNPNVTLSRHAWDGLLFAAGTVPFQGAAPTITVTAAAGTGAPAATVAAGSTDRAGSVTWGTGTGTASGAQIHVAFAKALPATPASVVLSNIKSNGVSQIYVGNFTATGFDICYAGTPPVSEPTGFFGAAWRVAMPDE